jgi:hypothetical protein
MMGVVVVVVVCVCVCATHEELGAMWVIWSCTVPRRWVRVWLGTFDTAEEAAKVYDSVAPGAPPTSSRSTTSSNQPFGGGDWRSFKNGGKGHEKCKAI